MYEATAKEIAKAEEKLTPVQKKASEAKAARSEYDDNVLERSLKRMGMGDAAKIKKELEGSLNYKERDFGIIVFFNLKGKKIKIDFHNLGFNRYFKSSPVSARDSVGRSYGPVMQQLHPFKFPDGKIVYLDYDDVGFDEGDVWINGNKLKYEDAFSFLKKLAEEEIYDMFNMTGYHSSGYLVVKRYHFLGALLGRVLGDIQLRMKFDKDISGELKAFRESGRDKKLKIKIQHQEERGRQRRIKEKEIADQQAQKGFELLKDVFKKGGGEV